MDSLVELFVAVDDFWIIFRPRWHEHLLASGERQRIRAARLSESEVMTIVILFHQSHYRNFKAFYLDYVCRHLRSEFPKLVSYSRFVTLMQQMGIPLYVTDQGKTGRIGFVQMKGSSTRNAQFQLPFRPSSVSIDARQNLLAVVHE